MTVTMLWLRSTAIAVEDLDMAGDITIVVTVEGVLVTRSVLEGGLGVELTRQKGDQLWLMET